MPLPRSDRPMARIDVASSAGRETDPRDVVRGPPPIAPSFSYITSQTAPIVSIMSDQEAAVVSGDLPFTQMMAEAAGSAAMSSMGMEGHTASDVLSGRNLTGSLEIRPELSPASSPKRQQPQQKQILAVTPQTEGSREREHGTDADRLQVKLAAAAATAGAVSARSKLEVAPISPSNSTGPSSPQPPQLPVFVTGAQSAPTALPAVTLPTHLASPVNLPTPRVLVVDDYDVNRVITTRLMQRLGCLVDTAEDGNEAVELCTRTPYDLVLMDCQMPQMDGFEATTLIKAMQPEMRIVALTADATAKCRDKYVALLLFGVLFCVLSILGLSGWILSHYLYCISLCVCLSLSLSRWCACVMCSPIGSSLLSVCVSAGARRLAWTIMSQNPSCLTNWRELSASGWVS